MRFVDSIEFRKDRINLFKQINKEDKEDQLFWQIIYDIKDEKIMGKWKKFKDYNINRLDLEDSVLRTSLNNEIIIDLDIKEFNSDGSLNLTNSIHSNAIKALEIIQKLELEKIKYSLYYSGNKGFHIHILIGSFNYDINKLVRVFNLRINNNAEFYRVLKESFLRYFNFDLGINNNDAIDERLFLRKQLIRAEGTKHIKSEQWKTYINLEGEKNRLKKIYDKIKVCKGYCDMNLNYFNEKNILNENISKFMLEYVQNNLKQKEDVCSRYNNHFSSKSFNLPKYISVFKKLYFKGQRYSVTSALVSFLYLATDKDYTKAKDIYTKEFLQLAEDTTQSKFYSRFEKVWLDCTKVEKVSIYSVLEKTNIISKEQFKEMLKNE